MLNSTASPEFDLPSVIVTLATGASLLFGLIDFATAVPPDDFLRASSGAYVY
jgi:hypothetical protein